jgi:hypothetical protein
MKDLKLKIELSSNLDYEGMVVFVSIGRQELAILNYERGEENIEIEFLPFPWVTIHPFPPIREMEK